MSVLVRRRLGAGLCAAFITGGLLVGAGAASAQDSNDPKCVAVVTAQEAKDTADKAYAAAKTALTNASSAVTKAEAAANAAPTDSALQTKLTEARAVHNKAMTAEASADSTRKGAAMNLAQAVDAAVKAGLKCGGGSTTTTTTRTSKPSSPSDGDPKGGGKPSGDASGGSHGPVIHLDCRDFVSRPAAQVVLDADRGDPNRLDADRDGYACEEFFGSPSKDPKLNQDVTVVHTEDDDSEADISGDQVTVVPEGSADTGSAL